jgi:hypothetical protein
MSLDSTIFAALSSTSGVTDLIGAGADCRAYPDEAPPEAGRKYVTWQHVSSDPFATHAGAVGIQHDLVQVMCWAETPEEASALRAAVVAALDGVELAAGVNPTLQDQRGEHDAAVGLHRRDADFLI